MTEHSTMKVRKFVSHHCRQSSMENLFTQFAFLKSRSSSLSKPLITAFRFCFHCYDFHPTWVASKKTTRILMLTVFTSVDRKMTTVQKYDCHH